jgi:ribonucleoside-diphosphate reductase alpha chain
MEIKATRQLGFELNAPFMPDDLGKVELTDNARQVLMRRYVRRDDNQQPAETIEQMFWRVAANIAKVEALWSGDSSRMARRFYDLLTSKRFFPNSPTFTGAGTPLGQLAACFVLPLSDDMGKKSAGIFQTLRDAALIQQTGGGNGFNFSHLRPKGTLVKSSAGQATGPVGFLRVYDHAFGEVAQGGTRRGANMAILRVDHPDIEEFITCKTDENQITNFNISVGITDSFMAAVQNDGGWDLKFPDVADARYRGFEGTFEQAAAAGIPLKTYKRVRARDLFDKIVAQAHHNGEPGLLFLDAANRANPVPHLYQLEATNPCGEQFLGPYENCCLGSINLAQFFAPDHKVDWIALQSEVTLATRFLDDVVDANKYVPAVPQLRESAERARRIGLGIMGLADLMYHVGVRYGSPAGQEFASQVMEFVRYHSVLTSIELSKERGPFPAIKGSIYDPVNITWEAPQPIMEYTHDWGRPPVDWVQASVGIQAYGIRNAAQTTVAPTGTIATVAGCEGYGCEPVFALAYTRHVDDNGKDLSLDYTSPHFEEALKEAGISEKQQKKIIAKVMEDGSCQKVEELPETIRDVFVVSQDICAEEHVRMQAAMQAFVDNSMSKTINFPSGATAEEVASSYLLAWELGCKGMTVYVTGSREKVVLETKATNAAKKTSAPAGTKGATNETDDSWMHLDEVQKEQPGFWQVAKKPRPRFLVGYTFTIETPLGKAFVTVNENSGTQPFEVFINTAKAGSDTAAVSEAIGRMISYVLRISSPVEPAERMNEIVRQLAGIGGGRSLGFGPKRVRSLPDGVAQVLNEYITQRSARLNVGAMITEQSGAAPVSPVKPTEQWTPAPETSEAAPKDQPLLKIGDLCPECGQAAVINEEGCRKCYACGYSEC